MTRRHGHPRRSTDWRDETNLAKLRTLRAQALALAIADALDEIELRDGPTDRRDADRDADDVWFGSVRLPPGHLLRRVP